MKYDSVCCWKKMSENEIDRQKWREITLKRYSEYQKYIYKER